MTRLSVSFLVLAPTMAEAHEYSGSLSAVAWTLDLSITLPLAVVVGIYLLGVARLWMRAGVGRGVHKARLAAFLCGWLLLVVALVSPMHAWGEHSLAIHMVEHELLMAVAAPLLVLSRPIPALLWGLSRGARIVLGSVAPTPIRGLWRALTQPHAATVVHAAAIWAWHVPLLFQAALAHEGVHWLQHASFLGSAVMFWWALLKADRERAAYATAVGDLFATSMHTGLLGALMVMSPRLLYVTTSAPSIPWNLTPLQDQQLAGLIMWVPGGLLYAGAAILFAGLLIVRSGGNPGGFVHALPAE